MMRLQPKRAHELLIVDFVPLGIEVVAVLFHVHKSLFSLITRNPDRLRYHELLALIVVVWQPAPPQRRQRA